jgi:hypothetical protein
MPKFLPLLLLLCAGCAGPLVPEEPTLDGSWRVVADDGSFFCLDIAGDRVVALFDQCSVPTALLDTYPATVTATAANIVWLCQVPGGRPLQMALSLVAQSDGTWTGTITVEAPGEPLSRVQVGVLMVPN